MSNWQWTQQARRSPDFYTVSKALDDYYRRDFSRVGDLIKTLFPYSWERRLQRDIPLIENLCKSHAIWYRRPPVRQWTTTDDEPLSDNMAAALRKIYKSLRVDQIMGNLSERLIVQRTMHGVIVPRPGSDGILLKVFAPWESEVDPHPMAPTSVTHAREFRFRVPITASHDSINFGTLRMNRSEAVYDYGNKTVGVYREDGSLPEEFGGRLPVFVARIGSPPPGDHMSVLPTDILAASEALSIALSDTDMAARFGSFGQMTITNSDRVQMEQLQMGPDTIVNLDDQQKLEVVTGKGNLTGYLEATEQFIKHVTVHNNLNPQSFLTGSLTGLSKAMDLLDRDAMRQDQLNALHDAEAGLYNAIRLVLNAGVRAESWPSGRVEVEYLEPVMPSDALHDAQSRRMAFEDGLSTPAQHLAKEVAISEEDAAERVASNLTAYRQLRSILTAPLVDEEPLAATALNGAQVASLINILAQVSLGTLGDDAAVALIAAAFPTVSEDLARRIVAGAQVPPAAEEVSGG